LIVKNLDAINGTPIIDIKPVFNEYLSKGDVNNKNGLLQLHPLP
jgi:tRNA (Thr-GGU) A37 N-methylase